MENYLDFINFYGVYYHAPLKEPETFVSMLSMSIGKATRYLHKSNIIDSIMELLVADDVSDIEALAEATGLSEEELAFYLVAVETLFPFSLKVKYLIGQDRIAQMQSQKEQTAINLFTETDLDDEEIAERLGVDLEKVVAARTTLPAIREEHQLIVALKEEDDVREFFTAYPYTTIREAAGQLKMPVRGLRIIVENMRAGGEDIKFNNVPVAMEREEIRRRVLETKKEDPSLTNSEVSLKLGISATEVSRAIKDALHVWQSEKADNYEFFFQKTMGELEDVKAECWGQHKNGKGRVSSRWMEIVLQAQEKQINMLGLRAPERVDIRQEIIATKEERDGLIDAALATDSIGVNFELIEVTGE